MSPPQLPKDRTIVILLLFVVVILALNATLCRSEAQAQVGASLEERQTIALERIASELARMRRDCR